MVIWITGLPGSGKSSVTDEIAAVCPEVVVLRMDELRGIATPDPAYTDSERDILYRAIVYCAMKFAERGQDVIIDATGNRRTWRELARRIIPSYGEVYLSCPLEVCMLREQERTDRHGAPGDIYRRGAEGWPVPGTTVPYEEPVNPEVTIDTGKTSVREAGEIIRKSLLIRQNR